ncbi:hypothetical protein AND_007969 [Anopheles darlingi]|uniref:Uncharacterized protein n=1 Tax=Anopheles darlingi TaxID=43151 RepID=W5JC60_ANODA|nr:hypothetical protein AND_007969 [Anopheles darlingi]
MGSSSSSSSSSRDWCTITCDTTKIFKFSSADVQASEHLLHASVLSMVEFDDDIFAGGNCFDWNQHPAKRGLFCPFAYRLPPPDQGASLVKDLALEYHYLGNTSEWFFLARKNAEKVIARNEQYIKSLEAAVVEWSFINGDKDDDDDDDGDDGEEEEEDGML